MKKPTSPSSSPLPPCADQKQWTQFLSFFLLTAGIGFMVAGVLFFFAYNWDGLPKFAKLGIVEVLLLAAALLAAFSQWSRLVKQVLLTGATWLTGILFAVFGQIYQTGADAYELFLGWTLFSFLWAAAARFSLLWLTFVGLLCTTIWLYAIQIVPDQLWTTTWLTNIVTWIGALSTLLAERSTSTNRRMARVFFLPTLVHASYLTMAAIYKPHLPLALPLTSTVLLFSLLLWLGWKRRDLFYLATLLFAILMLLLTVFVTYSHSSQTFRFFFAGIIVIGGTTAILYPLLQLKKRWYDTKK